jgi:hypothetical protein
MYDEKTAHLVGVRKTNLIQDANLTSSRSARAEKMGSKMVASVVELKGDRVASRMSKNSMAFRTPHETWSHIQDLRIDSQ